MSKQHRQRSRRHSDSLLHTTCHHINGAEEAKPMTERSKRRVAGAGLVPAAMDRSRRPPPRPPEDLIRPRAALKVAPLGPPRARAGREGTSEDRKGTPDGALIHFRTPRETVLGPGKSVRMSPQHSTVHRSSGSIRRRIQRTLRSRRRACPWSPRDRPMSRGAVRSPGESSGVSGDLPEVRFGS
jgi:hypothetical protein